MGELGGGELWGGGASDLPSPLTKALLNLRVFFLAASSVAVDRLQLRKHEVSSGHRGFTRSFSRVAINSPSHEKHPPEEWLANLGAIRYKCTQGHRALCKSAASKRETFTK